MLGGALLNCVLSANFRSETSWYVRTVTVPLPLSLVNVVEPGFPSDLNIETSENNGVRLLLF